MFSPIVRIIAGNLYRVFHERLAKLAKKQFVIVQKSDYQTVTFKNYPRNIFNVKI